MKSLTFTALSLCLTMPALYAGKSKTRYFADGSKVEAKLETDGEATQFSVTRYDDAMDADEMLYGDLTKEGDNIWRFEQKWMDDTEKEFVRTGKVTITKGSLSYSGMKDTNTAKDAKKVPASGGPWQEIPAATVLSNAKARYDTADKRLNEAWKTAKEEAGEKGLTTLQERQRNWLEHRDEMVQRITWNAIRAAGEAEDPDSVDFKSVPAYWNQMTYQTVDRTPILLAWSGKNVAAGKAGTYTDSFGGTVVISETKDGLDFEIDVVRTPSFALGNIGGAAKLNGDTATWTETPEDKEKKPAVVRLKFNADKSLTVETENAESYGGHRAYFDAQYFKAVTAGKKTP